jgi:hypothetical protein
MHVEFHYDEQKFLVRALPPFPVRHRLFESASSKRGDVISPFQATF